MLHQPSVADRGRLAIELRDLAIYVHKGGEIRNPLFGVPVIGSITYRGLFCGLPTYEQLSTVHSQRILWVLAEDSIESQ